MASSVFWQLALVAAARIALHVPFLSHALMGTRRSPITGELESKLWFGYEECGGSFSSSEQALEVAFLLDQGVSSAYSNRHGLPMPLMVALMQFFSKNLSLDVFFVMVDLLAAAFLYGIANRLKIAGREKAVNPALVFGVYLLNPFTVSSSMAHSSVNFASMAIVASYYHGMFDHVLMSMFFLALASNVALYPVVFIPSILATCRRAWSGVIKFLIVSVLLMMVSWSIAGRSWDFLMASHGARLAFAHSDPNIGPYWYFFAQIFPRFRNLFAITFQMHYFIYPLILAVRLWLHPRILFVITMGVYCALNPLLSVADIGMYITILLFTIPTLLNDTRLARPAALIMCVIYSILPIVTHYWQHLARDVGNVYFFLTLGTSVLHLIIIMDVMRTHLRKRILHDNPGVSVSDLYQK